MEVFGDVVIGCIGALHIYFLILEMFLWKKPLGLKVFRQTYEQAESSSRLAANQGLYNGFLAAGLIWGLVHPVPSFASQIQIFFLSCVVAAGLFGGITVNRRIFWIQGLPALAALFLLVLS